MTATDAGTIEELRRVAGAARSMAEIYNDAAKSLDLAADAIEGGVPETSPSLMRAAVLSLARAFQTLPRLHLDESKF